ncbi:MAG: phytoene/squalene synthase family protein [Flavobacteriaceae bacterium]|nr:phytoene/squalene synthase family protein [Flavobacteriaceae bacterium]
MKTLFDTLSKDCARRTTNLYSTSFSIASKLLAPSIRQDVYNIYGFVRLADEIVDSFHDYDKEALLNKFEEDLTYSIEHKISTNPILNAFQQTVHQYNIEPELYMAFMNSMRKDLYKNTYESFEEYESYIYGSADVVGLMCLKVFVKGDQQKYNALKDSAKRLGSAFQKVNFLRDLKQDCEDLQRTYFPGFDFNNLSEEHKQQIIAEIQADFASAYSGIKQLPVEARLGVYTAYIYYKRLLKKLKKTPFQEIRQQRIRVPNYEKISLLARSYVSYKLNLL